MSSTKGHRATSWTLPPGRHIFTARLRVREVSSQASGPGQPSSITTTMLLEDPNSGELFAAAPYTSAAVVEPTLDSSRFFALRVEGEGGRKAVLGVGFEDRSDAFEFSATLQEVRKLMGLVPETHSSKRGQAENDPLTVKAPAKVWALQPGETLHVDIGRSSSQVRRAAEEHIEPPSGGLLSFPSLAPPPSAKEVRADMLKRAQDQEMKMNDKAEFDDGEFGEFQ